MWIESKIKPEKSGTYMVHIYRSYIATFDGIINIKKKDNLKTEPEEYVTIADYNKKLDYWTVIDSRRKPHMCGIYRTIDKTEYICQEKIIEWQELPNFEPINASYKAFEEDEYSFENPYLSSLVRQRSRSADILKECRVKKEGSGIDTEYSIDIKTEKQYQAAALYFTMTKTDPNTGEIEYIEPETTGYNGPGIYTVTYSEDEKAVYIKKERE